MRTVLLLPVSRRSFLSPSPQCHDDALKPAITLIIPIEIRLAARITVISSPRRPQPPSAARAAVCCGPRRALVAYARKSLPYFFNTLEDDVLGHAEAHFHITYFFSVHHFFSTLFFVFVFVRGGEVNIRYVDKILDFLYIITAGIMMR